MTEPEFANLSATQTAQLVRQKQVSPVETVSAAISRIEGGNAVLNAVIYKGFDDAMAQARQLEAHIMRGEDVGPLAGVPTLMKDLFSFKPGWPATLGGIQALSDFAPDVYSTYPLRMEQAGAIILGKTNSATLGFCGTTDNKMFGPTRNPFDTTRNSGGSSGGSAAAVASQMVPLAEGSDAGGSIRIPAAWCGLVGFQPSFGCAPLPMRPNAFGGTAPFIHEGPLARSVDDIVLAMSVLAGHNARDPFSGATQPDFLSATLGSIKGVRIGLTTDFGIFPVDPEIADKIKAAGAAFEAAGAIVEPLKIDLPYSQQELTALWNRLLGAVTFGALTGLAEGGVDILSDHRDALPEPVLRWVDFAAGMPLAALQADQVMRTGVFDAFATAFETYDLILSPTTSCMPVLNSANGDTVGPEMINGTNVDPRIGWAMTYLTNFIGHPAASVPAGMVGELPVGLQIIGRRHGDLDVIAACAAFENIKPWATIYAEQGRG